MENSRFCECVYIISSVFCVGVLEANIALGNVKQACKCGQDALAMYPNSVLVLLAVGQAYCKQEGREEEVRNANGASATRAMISLNAIIILFFN